MNTVLTHLQRLSESFTETFIHQNTAVQQWRDSLLNPNIPNVLVIDHPERQIVVDNLGEPYCGLPTGIFTTRATTFQSALMRKILEICGIGDERNLSHHLQAALEVLITYSICTGSLCWFHTLHLRTLETLNTDLCVKLYNQLHDSRLATLINRAIEIKQLRSQIVRHLEALAQRVRPEDCFQAYNPEDVCHINNVAGLLGQLHPQTHYLTGMAFKIVVNPIRVNSEETPPSYSEK